MTPTTKTELNNITLDQILLWLIENAKDTVAMDKINHLSYIHTSKFLERNRSSNQSNPLDDGISIG